MYDTLAEIRAEVAQAMSEAGYADRAADITLKFDGRLVRTLATASCRFELGGYGVHSLRIRFSSQNWPHWSDEERRDTIRHEVGHIVAYLKYGRAHDGHGWKWQAIARQLGARPERGAKHTPKTQTVRPVCPLGHKFNSKIVGNLLLNAQKPLVCSRCKMHGYLTGISLDRIKHYAETGQYLSHEIDFTKTISMIRTLRPQLSTALVKQCLDEQRSA